MDDSLDQVSLETSDMLYNFGIQPSKPWLASSTTVKVTRKAWEHGQIEHVGGYMGAIDRLG